MEFNPSRLILAIIVIISCSSAAPLWEITNPKEFKTKVFYASKPVLLLVIENDCDPCFSLEIMVAQESDFNNKVSFYKADKNLTEKMLHRKVFDIPSVIFIREERVVPYDPPPTNQSQLHYYLQLSGTTVYKARNCPVYVISTTEIKKVEEVGDIVAGFPTVIHYKNGKPIKYFVGEMNRQDL